MIVDFVVYVDSWWFLLLIEESIMPFYGVLVDDDSILKNAALSLPKYKLKTNLCLQASYGWHILRS